MHRVTPVFTVRCVVSVSIISISPFHSISPLCFQPIARPVLAIYEIKELMPFRRAPAHHKEKDGVDNFAHPNIIESL